MDPRASLTAADFSPYLQRTFFVRLQDSETYSLQLVEVRELGESSQKLDSGHGLDVAPPGRRRPFSLLFRSPRRGAYLPQRTYRLEFEPVEGGPLAGSPLSGDAAENPSLAGLELFLVPLGPDQDGMRYEVIFT